MVDGGYFSLNFSTVFFLSSSRVFTAIPTLVFLSASVTLKPRADVILKRSVYLRTSREIKSMRIKPTARY
nr:unnamed protein product [Callosobruchus chinensis]